MKKKIVFGVLLAVIITAVVGTYMYHHRFDKYEQSQAEQSLDEWLKDNESIN